MILFFGVQLLGLLAATATSAQETAVLRLLVNTEDAGDTFAVIASDGDVLLPRSTLTDVGLWDVPPGEMVNDVPHVSLRSLGPDVTFSLDAQTGTLSLTIEPRRFAPTTKDYFFHQPPSSLAETARNSAFLNYGLIAPDADFLPRERRDRGHVARMARPVDDRLRQRRVRRPLHSAAHEPDVRQHGGSTTHHHRRRACFLGIAGKWTRAGGHRVSRDFGLTPYFYPTPALDLSGVLQTPSEVETYVNGQRASGGT